MINRFRMFFNVIFIFQSGIIVEDTEGCMGEQTSVEFDLTFGEVLLHKLVQAY